MKRTVAVLVIAFVGVLGLAWLVDRMAVGATARGISSDLSDAGFELGPDAEVRIEGFPYLTQLLIGRLTEVTITSSTATVDGLELTEVRGVARGVRTASPYLARTAELSAMIPESTLAAAVEQSGLSGGGLGVDVRIRGSALVASTSFLGLPVEAVLEPAPGDAAIALRLTSVTLAGITLAADDLPPSLRAALDDLAIPLAPLPPDLELTSMQILPGQGILIAASGADVELERLTTSSLDAAGTTTGDSRATPSLP